MRTTQTEPTTDTARGILRESADPRVLIADGYDVRLAVRSGQLRLDDGIRTGKRSRIISRADRIKRIIILAETGFVTLEALRWCELEGIGIAQYESDGRLVMLSGPSHDEPKIKRAQAIASADAIPSIRLETARALLTTKLEGQSRNALELLSRPDVSYLIDERVRGLSKASSLRELSGYEGEAAKAYWEAWTGNVHVPFPPGALAELPVHWATYRGRPSGERTVSIKKRNRSVAESAVVNRGATDPVNAMLNYAYRVAETEAKLACLSHGLDPGIGFLHVIESDRDAMALDIMEAARPVCDSVVLSLLDTGHGADPGRYFSPDWCYEFRHGVVRLDTPLTHLIGEHCLDFAAVIEPHVRNLALLLSTAHIPDLSRQGQPSMADIRTRNARVAMRSQLQRIPVPSQASDVIPDDAWAEIAPHIPIVRNVMGAKRADDRVVLAALVWCTANGQPLTRLPDSLRIHYHTVLRRVKEWESVGAWPRITRAIRKTVLPGFSG